MNNEEQTMLEAAELLGETAAKLREWYELPPRHRSGTELQLAGLVPMAAAAVRAIATVLDGSDDAEPARCEADRMTGVRCTALATTKVEWMPIALRDSHTQARNRGTYPANGAQRLPTCGACARDIVDADGEWASEVTSVAPRPLGVTRT